MEDEKLIMNVCISDNSSLEKKEKNFNSNVPVRLKEIPKRREINDAKIIMINFQINELHFLDIGSCEDGFDTFDSIFMISMCSCFLND